MNRAASVWRTVNELAARPGMINMGQGFPDFAGNAVARAAAREALEDPSSNQYSPQPGYESLREEVAAFIRRRYGDNVTVRYPLILCSTLQPYCVFHSQPPVCDPC